MVTVKEKPICNFKISGGHQTSTKSTATARKKSFIIDEPVLRCGTDEGPMPVKYEREAAIAVSRDLRHHCAVSKMLQESGTRVIEKCVLNGEALTVDA